MTRPGSRGALCLLALLLAHGREPLPAAAPDSTRPSALGKAVPRGAALRDLRGNRRAVHDYAGRAVVLVFAATDCPVSNLYLPALVELEKAYRAKGVQFLAVYPNDGEDLDQVAAHASDRDVPFPVLKDVGARLAEQLGVTRVPTVAVLDGGHVLRYRGRVDDRYGIASR